MIPDCLGFSQSYTNRLLTPLTESGHGLMEITGDTFTNDRKLEVRGYKGMFPAK